MAAGLQALECTKTLCEKEANESDIHKSLECLDWKIGMQTTPFLDQKMDTNDCFPASPQCRAWGWGEPLLGRLRSCSCHVDRFFPHSFRSISQEFWIISEINNWNYRTAFGAGGFPLAHEWQVSKSLVSRPNCFPLGWLGTQVPGPSRICTWASFWFVLPMVGQECVEWHVCLRPKSKGTVWVTLSAGHSFKILFVRQAYDVYLTLGPTLLLWHSCECNSCKTLLVPRASKTPLRLTVFRHS